MSVLETISEQCSFGFTGRINVLKRADSQFLGVIYIKDGSVVASQFAKKSGLAALYTVIIFDIDDREDFKLVVEPEIVEDSDIEFNLTYSELKKKTEDVYQSHQEATKLRPPENLRIVINPDFIKSGDKPNSIEFKVLKVLTEFSKVGDIYKNCDLFDFEITNSLVNLRKKNALKVLG